MAASIIATTAIFIVDVTPELSHENVYNDLTLLSITAHVIIGVCGGEGVLRRSRLWKDGLV